MSGMRFLDAFWNAEWNNYTGFETVCARLNEERQKVKDIAEHLKQRSQIEMDYGKKLRNLARKTAGSKQKDILDAGWEEMKRSTDKIGELHERYGNALMEQYKQLMTKLEQWKARRKSVEETVRKQQSETKANLTKLHDAKTSYHKRCDNTEAVQSEVEKLNAIHSTPGKDLERANERYANARKAEKESKATYESAVKTLQRNKECLEREMERCFEVFQELEEDRVRFIRFHMWHWCNIGCQVAVDEDGYWKLVQHVLRNCVTTDIIQSFIQAKGTGHIRPERIYFEEYYMRIKSTTPSRPFARNDESHL